MLRAINSSVFMLLLVIIGACSSTSDGGSTSTTSGSDGSNGSGATTVARAGADQTVSEGDLVTLDAGQSTPGDNLTITSYTWSQDVIDSVQAVLGDTSQSVLKFSAPLVDTTSLLHLHLSVEDSAGHQASDDVIVTVTRSAPSAHNTPPTAVALVNSPVAFNETVSLDGTYSSDPDNGDSIQTYQWLQIDNNPKLSLSGDSSDTATFNAPQVTQTTVYIFRLSVTDTQSASDATTVNVIVKPATPLNHAPNAVALASNNSQTVGLDGTQSSDPDLGDGIATYHWTQIDNNPTLSLTGADTNSASFATPVASNYTLVYKFRLDVTDTHNSSGSDVVWVVINAASSTNQAPTAVATTANEIVSSGETVMLDGSASSDPDAGDSVIAYSWTETNLNNTLVSWLSDNVSASASFIAPVVSQPTPLSFELLISDSIGAQAHAKINLTVMPALPLANAGTDIHVMSGSAVTLNGSTSIERDRTDTLHYTWTALDSASLTLSDAYTATPSFQAPVVSFPSVLRFRLTVNNNKGEATSDDVNVTVLPAMTPSDYLVPVSTVLPVIYNEKIDLIDNANPDKMITIENIGVDDSASLYQYDHDVASNTISNGRPEYFVYRKNGKIWRLNLAKGSASLTPQQISANDDVACSMEVPDQWSNAQTASIFFESAGLDADCATTGDNRFHVIEAGYSPSDSAVDITDAVYRQSTLNIGVVDGGVYATTNFATANKLRFYSTDFSAYSDILDVISPSAVNFFDVKSLRYLYVAVDGKLYAINKLTATASGVIWDLANGTMPSITCGPAINGVTEQCYFTFMTASFKYSIYRFPADGSAVASDLIGSELSAIPINLIASKNSLFYAQRNSTNATDPLYSLYRFPAYPVAGDTPTVVANNRSYVFYNIFTNGDYLFYEIESNDANGNLVDASVVIVDEYLNNKQVLPNSRLAGVPLGRGLTFATIAADAKVFIANAIPSVASGMSGAMLQSYDAASGVKIRDIGLLPGNAGVFDMIIANVPSYGVGRYYARTFDKNIAIPSNLQSLQSDIVLLDAASNPAFTNISITPTLNEWQWYWH